MLQPYSQKQSDTNTCATQRKKVRSFFFNFTQMDCIRVGVVFEFFYQRFVEPKKSKMLTWAQTLEKLRNKAALTPKELLQMLQCCWAVGCRFYNTQHGQGKGEVGSCFELLNRLFTEAAVVYEREKKDIKDKALADALRVQIEKGVSRDEGKPPEKPGFRKRSPANGA